VHRLRAASVAVALAFTLASCGSGTPPYTPPTAVPPPPVQQPPANKLPVIDSVTVQGTRAKEPANFADLNEAVPVVAKVHDEETAADQLDYQWSATLGTFTGTGASVTWKAPATAATTPVDVVITLKVVEKYGFPGQAPAFSQDVSGTATLSLHDTVKEVGDMARQFLLDFSDSNITDVAHVMRNFDMSCRDAQAEAEQVADNRRRSRIVKFDIGAPTVTVPFGNAFCPIDKDDPGRTQRGDACSRTPAHWESTEFANGHYIIAEGFDWVSAYYKPELKAWKLCDSQFPGVCRDATTGMLCGAATLNSIAPDSVHRRIELPR